MNNFCILAQAGSRSKSEGPSVITAERVGEKNETTAVVAQPNMPASQPAPRPKVNPLYQYLPLILLFVVVYFLMFRGPRKKQQQQKKMIQALKKNDRVRTIGGIIGTIVDVKNDEITLKIDESNNTKIKVVASAVSRNLSQEKD